MKKRYLYEYPDVKHETWQLVYKILNEFDMKITRIHHNEIFATFKHEQDYATVHLVTKDNGRIVHIDSSCKREEDPYVMALQIKITKSMKAKGYNLISHDYFLFYESEYPLKNLEEGASPSLYDKYKKSKSDRYIRYVIYLIVYESIGLIFTVAAGIFLKNLIFWIVSFSLLIGIGLIIIIINEVLERHNNVFYKGKREDEEEKSTKID